MGTWSNETFENDAASDFVITLGEVGFEEVIKKINDLSNQSEKEINQVEDSWFAEELLVVCEAITVLLNNASDYALESFKSEYNQGCLAKAKLEADELLDLTFRSNLTKIAEAVTGPSSELYQLWSENSIFDDQKKYVSGLIAKINPNKPTN